MSEIKAVAIDFDDTLCLTEEACFNLENATLNKIGRGNMERGVHKKTLGMPLYDAIAVRSPGVDQDTFWAALPSIHEQFIQDGMIDVVTDDNLTALDKIVSFGLVNIILTSRTEIELKHLLDPTHHLSSKVAHIYHSNNTRYLKPDPRVFDVMLADHQLQPSECIYVGDSPSDAAATNGAGMLFVATLESGLRTEEDFKDYKVDAFISSFVELPEVIANLRAK